MAMMMAGLWLAGLANAVEVSEIVVTGDTEYTRIMFAADERLSHEAFLLMGEGGRRLVDVKLEGGEVALDAHTPPPTGGIDAYEIRSGDVLFSLTTPMMVSRALNLSPTSADPRHRLVVDLVRVAPVRFERAALQDADARSTYLAARPDAGNNMRMAGQLGARPEHYVVVIDAGHGGRDPGAMSRSGKQEKAIVLATALEMKKVLERSKRYKVHLTREDDRYIEHEDRVSMARRWGADLFISVHADAAGSSEVSGATVYTLSAHGERRVDRTAATNGWDMPIETGTSMEVSGILADLIKRETKSNSSIFAEYLIPELSKAGPIVRNSHRQENFFVLLAPDVPAVLLEIGFLTNQSDVTRLSSEAGRRKTAEAVGRAIDRYFDRRDLLYAAN